jgi:hypothetical protein
MVSRAIAMPLTLTGVDGGLVAVVSMTQVMAHSTGCRRRVRTT